MNQQPRKKISAILLSTDYQFVFSFDVVFFFFTPEMLSALT